MEVCILVFDPARDAAVSRALADASGGKVVPAGSVSDLLSVTGAMDLVLGVRLHALIFAAAQGVPAVGLSYDPKVASFMLEAGLQGLLPVDAPPAVVEEALSRAWDARTGLRTRLQARLATWHQAAADGIDAALRLV
jgi:polysaccharide pyruvyl transferase WcaK-like protein